MTSRNSSRTAGPRTRTPGCHPSLVPGPDLVLDVRRQFGEGGGLGVTEQRALDADQVRQHVTHRPPRALRGKIPLRVGEALSQGVDGLPLLGQDGDDRLLRSVSSRHPFPRGARRAGTRSDQCDNPPPPRPAPVRPSRRPSPVPATAEGAACPPSACGAEPGDSFDPSSGGAHSEEDERGFVRGLLCEMP